VFLDDLETGGSRGTRTKQELLANDHDPTGNLSRILGLVEAITSLNKEKPPPTHQHGQSPINGIFVSPALLDGAQGGYLAFDKGLGSNH